MTGSRIAVALGVAFACAIAALAVVPRGIEAGALLHAQDDPAQLADLRLKRAFNATVATREIEEALAAGDVDLANSFVDLARDRNVALDPALVARVENANSTVQVAIRGAGSFGRGLITGEPDDVVSLAGTALGDVFVFGDIRDAVREGSRLATGQKADELILGLSCVGLAITAGTYFSLGAATPARIGVSLVKAARRTGRITAHMSEWLGRSLREAVDWSAAGRAVAGASITAPVVAVRAAREVVKVEKAKDLMRVAGDVGQIQAKAGTRAALDTLNIARGPADVARVSRLALTKGSSTRAILKTLGRSAIFLGSSAMSLFSWLLTAVMTIFGFCAACKRTAENATQRYCDWRRTRRARAQLRFAAMTARA